jgi:hypothetical protein
VLPFYTLPLPIFIEPLVYGRELMCTADILSYGGPVYTQGKNIAAQIKRGHENHGAGDYI